MSDPVIECREGHDWRPGRLLPTSTATVQQFDEEWCGRCGARLSEVESYGEHGIECGTCHKTFDARDLTQVLYHETHRPTAVLDVPLGRRVDTRPAPACHACVNGDHKIACGGPESGCGCAARNHEDT